MAVWRSYIYEMFGHRVDNVENKNRVLEKRVDELEATIHLKNKIITAAQAYRLTIESEEETSNAELVEAFDVIRKTTKGHHNKVVFDKYDCCDELIWHVEELASELQKYGYKVKLTKPNLAGNRKLKVSWKKPKVTPAESIGSAPQIDPDKKYILPMERTTTSDYMRNYAYYNTGHWLVSGGALDDDWAERSGYTVYGKDILSAPDWVKAIKPIEVKE